MLERWNAFVLVAILAGCGATTEKTTGTNWVTCSQDADCASLPNAHCGPDKVCIDAIGRVVHRGGDSGAERADDAGTGAVSCNAPRPQLFGSNDAVVLARCNPALPQDAQPVMVRSSPLGEMTAEGLSPRWNLAFLDGGGVAYSVGVGPGGETITSGPNPCWTDAVALVDSRTVVPDALRRYATIGSATGPFNYFYWEQGACPGQGQPAARYVQVLRHLGTTVPSSDYYFFHYDDAGTMTLSCGPTTEANSACSSP